MTNSASKMCKVVFKGTQGSSLEKLVFELHSGRSGEVRRMLCAVGGRNVKALGQRGAEGVFGPGKPVWLDHGERGQQWG